MERLPQRAPEYQGGPSTPRPMRINNRLWRDFVRVAREQGYTAAAAIRLLMERYVREYGSGEKEP